MRIRILFSRLIGLPTPLNKKTNTRIYIEIVKT
jgi:hypothetical protein